MKIFCVGIGGIGLSGVARILQSLGHDVSGSDASSSEITAVLNENGISVHAHTEKNIDTSFDLLIYSEAVPENNPERTQAKTLGVKQINYAKALGMLSEGKKTVAITGTHGKTTTTGMLTSIFLAANLDPTIIIGSKIDLLNGQNFRIGKSDLFLCEACEYRDNFLELTPDVVLINTLEPDHLDYFGTAERYYESFQKLAEKIPESGTLLLFDSAQEKLNLASIKASVKILFGKDIQQYHLNVPGKQNQHNANAAASVARVLGVSEEHIQKGLENFNGTWRRFEYKGSINGAKVYDDYGHHPTEIRATIQAAREWYADKKLIVIFQPHQYSRTHQFFDEFTTSFTGADEVWVTDIYKARDSEEDIAKTSAQKLSAAIAGFQSSRHVPLNSIPEEIQKLVNENTIFLVMGAGNINGIFHQLLFDPESK